MNHSSHPAPRFLAVAEEKKPEPDTSNDLPRLPVEMGERSLVAQYHRMAEMYWLESTSDPLRSTICTILLKRENQVYMTDDTIKMVQDIEKDQRRQRDEPDGDRAMRLRAERMARSHPPAFQDPRPVFREDPPPPGCPSYEI